ncbi:MAG: hypothetical protein ACR2RD_13700 [Woeseiaceae bacterium]
MITAAFFNQVCENPDVIDVSSADRFGEQVIVISIPTSAEHDRVKSLLPADGHEYTLHITPVFGLGFFTGDSKETKGVLSLMHVSPYNIYGTPENKNLERLLKDVEVREAEVWASMNPEAKRAAIEEEVERQRSAGRPDFGNCWSD